ncbi:MAG: 16S rRNA (uracil(1498)-N(3))-methyltransferase [Gammaproteobacteria bacterium]|nr:16S rRNA (uracil(1498)-N(3))-methyltransferase [Gammaproteobacteria bacterium]
MTRIYLAAQPGAGSEIELPPAAAKHVARVLRMQAGEALTLFSGAGDEFAARIVSVAGGRVMVQVLERLVVDRESPLAVTLAQCLSRGQKMDLTLQKAVELGVATVQPLASRRSVVRLNEARAGKRLEHWHGVMVSAAEQSGRTRLPALRPLATLAEWLPGVPGTRICLHPPGGATLRELNDRLSPHAGGEVTVLVGPEGGFDPLETEAIDAAGFHMVSLGPRILRTETAGMAVLAALQALYGDLA